jgi:hypothetical protein
LSGGKRLAQAAHHSDTRNSAKDLKGRRATLRMTIFSGGEYRGTRLICRGILCYTAT